MKKRFNTYTMIELIADSGEWIWLIFSVIDFCRYFCYIKLSDRSVETCEAHRRGRTCGSLPLFILRENKHMATQKSFLTFTQQVTSLSDKNIIISNSQYAEEMLQRIGYFSLMGYKHLFRIPLTKKYKSGTSFDEIVALYQFDAEPKRVISEISASD